ncbi:MAG: carbohydrate ABC transporter permease [Ruminococcus sp.]|jgi:raffinose/stachyose/melibiose transport system permease protein|nr:carbohydrate ABC transporter permease [Ruminococcus sp.]
MSDKKKIFRVIGTVILSLLSVLYLCPILIILMNSFKKKTYISLSPFSIPTDKTAAGFENYISAIEAYGFFDGIVDTLIIVIGSVALILFFCSMAAWYITRVKTKVTKALYILCVFSMVVPFQMVMFTLSKTADTLKLNTPWGITIIYLGFGAGLAVFMFYGFVKGIPLEIEEAAMMDGCSPLRTFFLIDLPMMQPTFISVGILQTMWIWNDFLLPYLVLDQRRYKTISMIIQTMKGSYGRVDMGAIMACLIMAVIPVVVFYLFAQKYIIEGVAAGAVKG